jgi:hypothetical protein
MNMTTKPSDGSKRKQPRNKMPMTKQRLDIPLKLKSVSDSGEFEGYGSVLALRTAMTMWLFPALSVNHFKHGERKTLSRQCSGSTRWMNPSGCIQK